MCQSGCECRSDYTAGTRCRRMSCNTDLLHRLVRWLFGRGAMHIETVLPRLWALASRHTRLLADSYECGRAMQTRHWIGRCAHRRLYGDDRLLDRRQRARHGAIVCRRMPRRRCKQRTLQCGVVLWADAARPSSISAHSTHTATTALPTHEPSASTDASAVARPTHEPAFASDASTATSQSTW